MWYSVLEPELLYSFLNFVQRESTKSKLSFRAYFEKWYHIDPEQDAHTNQSISDFSKNLSGLTFMIMNGDE